MSFFSHLLRDFKEHVKANCIHCIAIRPIAHHDCRYPLSLGIGKSLCYTNSQSYSPISALSWGVRPACTLSLLASAWAWPSAMIFSLSNLAFSLWCLWVLLYIYQNIWSCIPPFSPYFILACPRHLTHIVLWLVCILQNHSGECNHEHRKYSNHNTEDCGLADFFCPIFSFTCCFCLTFIPSSSRMVWLICWTLFSCW